MVRSINLSQKQYRKKMVARNSATAVVARVDGYYAVQGHLRTLISVPIDSPYATSY